MLSGKIVPTLKKKNPSHAGPCSCQLRRLVLLSDIDKNSQPVEPWSTILLVFIDMSFKEGTSLLIKQVYNENFGSK